MMRTQTQAVVAATLVALVPLAAVQRAAAQSAPPGSEPPPNYTPPPPPPPPPGHESAPNEAVPPGYAPPSGHAPPRSYARGGRARASANTEVRFEPEEPDIALLSMSGTVPVERFHPYRHWWGERYSYGWAPTYSPICDQACATRFATGPYHLALSKNGGPPVPAYGPAVVRGPSLIRGSYADRSGVRAAGWVVGIGGLVGGIVMIAVAAQDERRCDPDGYCYHHETANTPLLVGGIAVLVVSSIVGGVLAAQPDEARISVEPLQLSSYGALREAVAALGAGSAPQGAALALHF